MPTWGFAVSMLVCPSLVQLGSLGSLTWVKCVLQPSWTRMLQLFEGAMSSIGPGI